jgi:4-hydroxybenzoate polyprenyltransferase
VFSLARLHVYLPVCFMSTLLGLEVVGGRPHPGMLVGISAANVLALVMAHIFNDVEDATEDVLDPRTRNPIARGELTSRAGRFLAFSAGGLSLLVGALIEWRVFWLLFGILWVTFLYSWRRIRIKKFPFWDVGTHAVVGGLVFLTAAWSTEAGVVWNRPVGLLCGMFALGLAAAILTHQFLEQKQDMAAGVRTTVVVLGSRAAGVLLTAIFILIAGLVLVALYEGIVEWRALVGFLTAAAVVLGVAFLISDEDPVRTAKQTIPWAVNLGAAAAVVIGLLV